MYILAKYEGFKLYQLWHTNIPSYSIAHKDSPAIYVGENSFIYPMCVLHVPTRQLKLKKSKINVFPDLVLLLPSSSVDRKRHGADDKKTKGQELADTRIYRNKSNVYSSASVIFTIYFIILKHFISCFIVIIFF